MSLRLNIFAAKNYFFYLVLPENNCVKKGKVSFFATGYDDTPEKTPNRALVGFLGFGFVASHHGGLISVRILGGLRFPEAFFCLLRIPLGVHPL